MSNKNNKSPIFPMIQSQHFSDYGFDPQIHYFQVLEEAKKHKSSIDTFQFKLQKPISKDDLIRTTLHNKNKNKKRWLWCKNALFFFKCRKWPISRCSGGDNNNEFDDRTSDDDVHIARARNFRAGSLSGPVYVTESWSGSSTPYRTMTTTSAVHQYLSLRELNMERQQRITTSSSSMSGPIYLVT
ncbi:PREDICTED: uncharacterized protein LOC104723584 isoform X1 [Camelina sativa]|uniref:Uncharacterized protein LOC104723584 isoform X1 n=1 Tax=Camelina sativa TaxID=90675 RepID=A0ABM0UF68_CAMSA|nr:PREDICTED: uncharacterized protein LOC104723584 isoform X1 [Camelina sativa]